jgi:hypothetical protein
MVLADRGGVEESWFEMAIETAEFCARMQFDPVRYRAANSDLQIDDEALCTHWANHGRDEERRGLRPRWRAPHFDRHFYLHHNPDVIALIENGDYNTPEEHWIVSGREELASGKRPAFGDFDEAAYLAHRPDVAFACSTGVFKSGVDHWLSCGRWEEREARTLPHRPVARTNDRGSLSEEKQAFWHDNGFVVLEGAITPELCEKANKRINELWTTRRKAPPPFSIDVFLETPECRRIPMSQAPGQARSVSYKINDLYKFDETIRSLALDPDVCDALRWVLEGDPTIIASLNFERGSTQRLHTDTLYMPGIHTGTMTAAWFALEDVTAPYTRSMAKWTYTIDIWINSLPISD